MFSVKKHQLSVLAPVNLPLLPDPRPWWHLRQHFVLQMAGYFHVSLSRIWLANVRLLSGSLYPQQVRRCTALAVIQQTKEQPHFHGQKREWRWHHRAPPFPRLPVIVLSCEGSAPPHRISQVVLDSLKLRKIQTIGFSFRQRRGWAVVSRRWVWCWKWSTQQQYIHSCASPEEHGCYALLRIQEE